MPAPTVLIAPREERWGQNMGTWARRHPGLALLLLVLTFGAPFAMTAVQRSLVRQSMTTSLDQWQAQLAERGLPVPFVPGASIPPPPSLPRDPRGLEPLGLAGRMRLLLAWEALLSGEAPLLPEEREPWPSALRACAALRAAAAAPARRAELLQRAAEETAQSPPEVRPTLELCSRLLEGRAQEVLAAAGERAERADPPSRGALQALAREARRQRVLEILAARPPGLNALEELVHAAQTAPETVAAALDEEASRLAQLLTPGDGDLQRAAALLDVFEALSAANRPAGAAWQAARAAIAEVISTRLRRFEDDPQPALKLATRLVQRDPEADVPRSALTGWRERLSAVVNDAPQLLRVAGTLLELGHLPPALEELIPAVDGLDDPAAGTPGRILGAALARALPALARGEPPPAAELAPLLERLEQALGDRHDPLARRIRAQAALVQGRALLAAGDAAGARGALLRALEDHPARFRVLLALAGARTALGGAEELAHAGEELQQARRDLDARADALGASQADLPPELALELELAGRPTDQRALIRWRALLLQARARLEAAAGQAEPAIAHSREALDLRSEDGELWLAHARLLLQLERKTEAGEAALQGLSTRPTSRIAGALRELLNQLGPR